MTSFVSLSPLYFRYLLRGLPVKCYYDVSPGVVLSGLTELIVYDPSAKSTPANMSLYFAKVIHFQPVSVAVPGHNYYVMTLLLDREIPRL